MTGPAGLPLGYDHTETGAVEAATNYLTWMNSLRIKDKTTADAMAEATAADEKTRDAMIESFDALRTGLDDVTDGRDRAGPRRYAVAELQRIRCVRSTSGHRTSSPTSGETDHSSGASSRFVWSGRSDWKLDGALISRIGGAAVDPADPTGNPTPAEKQDILSRTPADPGEITDSADQQWFEYANAAR